MTPSRTRLYLLAPLLYAEHRSCSEQYVFEANGNESFANVLRATLKKKSTPLPNIQPAEGGATHGRQLSIKRGCSRFNNTSMRSPAVYSWRRLSSFTNSDPTMHNVSQNTRPDTVGRTRLLFRLSPRVLAVSLRASVQNAEHMPALFR